MATQETLSSSREQAAEGRLSSVAPKVSLVVDQPAATGQALLLLPFASASGEEAVGRHLGLLLQRRLQQLPDLAVGLGMLVAIGAETRRYLSLPRPLSSDQALTCAAEWKASAVLFGSIAVQPDLEWSLTLIDTASERVLLDETISGAAADLPRAIVLVARWVALALRYSAYDQLVGSADTPDTLNPGALLAYLEAAEARSQYGIATGSVPAMRAALSRALTLDPTFRVAALALMSDLAASGDDDQLASLLTDGWPLEREQIPFLSGLVDLALEHNHDRQAETLSEAILEIQPDCPQGLVVLSRLAYRARRFSQARIVANRLLDLDSENLLAHELLAESLAAEGRFVGAAQEWEYLTEHYPDQPRAWQRLGTYLFVAGEHQRAYLVLRQAADHADVSVDALLLLGILSYRHRAYQEAIPVLQRALQRDPTLARAHALLASCYRRLGDEQLALRHTAHTVALAPSRWLAALALGYDALQAGRPVDAVVSFAYVVHTRPDLPEALYGLGQALVAGGMVFDGVLALDRARELDRYNPRILCALARAQQQAGNSLAASQAVEAAEALAPGSGTVARTRRDLKQAAYDS